MCPICCVAVHLPGRLFFTTQTAISPKRPDLTNFENGRHMSRFRNSAATEQGLASVGECPGRGPLTTASLSQLTFALHVPAYRMFFSSSFN